jgi:hypothetical protein
LFVKTKYKFMSCHQNACQNLDIKIGNRSFENVAQFKYLGMTVTDQNLIQEEIKRKPNSGPEPSLFLNAVSGMLRRVALINHRRDSLNSYILSSCLLSRKRRN